jgi:hypothetical protein
VCNRQKNAWKSGNYTQPRLATAAARWVKTAHSNFSRCEKNKAKSLKTHSNCPKKKNGQMRFLKKTERTQRRVSDGVVALFNKG